MHLLNLPLLQGAGGGRRLSPDARQIAGGGRLEHTLCVRVDSGWCNVIEGGTGREWANVFGGGFRWDGGKGGSPVRLSLGIGEANVTLDGPREALR